MSLVARRARVEDAAAIVAIQGAVAAEGDKIATWAAEVRTPEEEARRLASPEPGFTAFVAELDGSVVGVAGVARGARASLRHTAEVGLSVAPGHRGRGVGRALMLAAEAWARGEGILKMRLGVYAHNAPARGLYSSLGYVEEGVLRGQHRLQDGRLVDEVLMARWLDGRA